ncbi:TFIIB-type zinc ribbon-containing protein [Secundilactobacillus hailunensis]|nr:TFIIB-type zinc ribbon-containing protein [Secundilactobacillus hailunensis]
MKSSDVTIHCPECGDIVFEKHNNGEIVCAECGHVINSATK